MANDKLEKDYEKSSQNIELIAQQEIQQIRMKIRKTKKEAEALGESIEESIVKYQAEAKKKS
jgi:hypothetical protein